MIHYSRITQDFVDMTGSRKAAGQFFSKSAKAVGNWISSHNQPDKTYALFMLNRLIRSENEAVACRSQASLGALRKAYPYLKELSMDTQTDWRRGVSVARMKEAMAYQKKGGERRGRFSKKSLKGEEKTRSGGFLENPYTDKAVAELFNIGSEDTFARAKKIMASEIEPLIQAMEARTITVTEGVQLLALPRAQLFDLLAQEPAAVKRFFGEKKRSVVLEQKRVKWVMKMHQKIVFVQAQYEQPLYLVLLAAAYCCDIQHRFENDMRTLVGEFGLSASLLKPTLETLCQEGFLRQESGYFVMALEQRTVHKEVPYALT